MIELKKSFVKLDLTLKVWILPNYSGIHVIFVALKGCVVQLELISFSLDDALRWIEM